MSPFFSIGYGSFIHIILLAALVHARYTPLEMGMLSTRDRGNNFIDGPILLIEMQHFGCLHGTQLRDNAFK